MNGRTLLSMRVCDPARLEGGMDDREQLDRLTESIIGSAIEVHRALGPGLLESAYERCLSFDLATRGVAVEHQKPIPLFYKKARIVNSYPDSSHPLRPSAASALKGNAS
jgi:hypothetical protein